MNVATVLQVSSSSPTTNSTGSIAIAAPALAGEPGAFSSLLDGLVNKHEQSFLARLLEEPPVTLAGSNAAPVSARAKGEDTRNAENNTSSGKKQDPQPNVVSVPATGEPPIIKPSILFRAATWATYSQDPAASTTEPQADEAANGHPDTAGSSATLSRPTSSIPDGNEPAAAARIAFGLHLTASNQEADTPAPGALEGKQNCSTSDSTDLEPAISAASVATDTHDVDINHVDINQVDINHGTPSSSMPVLNVRNYAEPPVFDLPLPLQRAPSLAKVPEPFHALGSGDVRDDNGENTKPATETSLWPGVSARQQDSQGSDSDGKPAPAPSSSAVPVSNLSMPLASPQAVGLQAAVLQKLPEEAGKQNAVPGDASSSTSADRSDATPTRAPAADWIASLQPQQDHPAGNESVNRGPVFNGLVLNMLGSQTDAARDLPEPNGNESRGNTGTVEAQPNQATGGMNALAGRPAAAPPRLTSPGGTLPPAKSSLAATSPAATSPAATSPATSPTTLSQAMQAASSQATSSQATPLQTSVQGVPSPVPLSQTNLPQATPPQTTATQTAMTALEPQVSTVPKPPAATQISLQLTGEGSTKVNIDLSERAGKVQVAVRTADPDLTKSMRTDLGDLVERLESKGFKTEAWVPASSRHVPAAPPEQSGSANSQSNPRQSGSGMDQRQGRPGQNGSNQRQHARWTAQLEETLSTEETRTTNE